VETTYGPGSAGGLAIIDYFHGLVCWQAGLARGSGLERVQVGSVALSWAMRLEIVVWMTSKSCSSKAADNL
jgi:hypothetical protein